MSVLLLILLVLLAVKFPPGTNLEWNIGETRVIWPIGWCLAITLVLTVILALFRKS